MQGFTFFASLIVLLSTTSVQVAAFGERGAAERALIWLAYQAEGAIYPLLDKENAPPFSICPGCKGSGPGGRCTFGELMSFTWAPNPDDPNDIKNKPAKDSGIVEGAKGKSPTLKSITQAIMRYKSGLLTGFLNIDGVFPGDTDFYDTLKKLSSPLPKAQSMLADAVKNAPGKSTSTKDRLQARYQKLIDMGTAAAELTHVLREKDMEFHRCVDKGGALSGKDYVNGKVVTKTAKSANPIVFDTQGEFPVLDVDETLKANPSLKAEDFNKILAKYATDDADHSKALESAKECRMKCKCP